MLSKNQLNSVIIDNLEEMMHLQNNIKSDDLEYTVKKEEK